MQGLRLTSVGTVIYNRKEVRGGGGCRKDGDAWQDKDAGGHREDGILLRDGGAGCCGQDGRAMAAAMWRARAPI